jgi:hypothetical protein
MSLKRLKIAFWIAALLLVADIGRQVGAAEIKNAELQEDMRDVATQLGTRIGLSDFPSDEQFRDAVIHKAENYDIPLKAEQITVEHSGSGKDATVYLAADYDSAIQVANYSYVIHFEPNSNR